MAYNVEDEPGEVVGGEPVAQVERQQERLVAVPAQEAMSHTPFYYFALLTPNGLILNSVLRKEGVTRPPTASWTSRARTRLVAAGCRRPCHAGCLLWRQRPSWQTLLPVQGGERRKAHGGWRTGPPSGRPRPSNLG